MINSMTGYGRGEWEGRDWLCRVEVKSVNHRYLDIHSHLPSELANLDAKIKRWIQARIKRGRIDLFLTLERSEGQRFSLNTPLLEGYLDALLRLKKEYSLTGEVDPVQLLRTPGILNHEPLQISEDERVELETGIASGVSRALSDLEVMRAEEGRALCSEVQRRLDAVKMEVDGIESQLEGLLELHRERLRARMECLLAEVNIDPARLLQEAAYHADRGDISEELARLNSHVKQCRALLETSGEVGKKIDFMMQEMNREANTILSKNAGLSESKLDITKAAISIKTEIEKIREQIQNVE